MSENTEQYIPARTAALLRALAAAPGGMLTETQLRDAVPDGWHRTLAACDDAEWVEQFRHFRQFGQDGSRADNLIRITEAGRRASARPVGVFGRALADDEHVKVQWATHTTAYRQMVVPAGKLAADLDVNLADLRVDERGFVVDVEGQQQYVPGDDLLAAGETARPIDTEVTERAVQWLAAVKPRPAVTEDPIPVDLPAPLGTPDGVTYYPWSNGYALGFKAVHNDGRVTYLYLSPSDGDAEGQPNVFAYHGPDADPDTDPNVEVFFVFPQD